MLSAMLIIFCFMLTPFRRLLPRYATAAVFRYADRLLMIDFTPHTPRSHEAAAIISRQYFLPLLLSFAAFCRADAALLMPPC